MPGSDGLPDLAVAPLNPTPHLVGEPVSPPATPAFEARPAANHVSVRATVERSLDAIEDQNEQSRAFVTVLGQEALGTADELDRVATARRAGPQALLGATVAVQDCIGVKGAPNTCGTASRRDVISTSTAPSVAALESAGAVVVGTTNLHEWAFGATSQNEAYGAVANPWGVNRIPGGSSGGSAVAVASGMASLALGTDTGGSIRLPASYCGVAGLKVTTGSVSTERCFPLSWTMDSIGPLAATVPELAAPLEALLATGERRFPERRLPSLDQVRVGVWPGTRESARLHDGVSAAFNRALALLGAEAELVELELPDLARVASAQMTIVTSEAASVHSGSDVDRGLYEGNVRGLLELGDAVSATDYISALRHRQPVWSQMARVFSEVDVVVSPTTPCVAPAVDADAVVWPDGSTESVLDASIRYLLLWNFIGAPCLSFPCGLSDGLPVGFQAAAAPGSDRSLVALGAELESLVRPPECVRPCS